LDRIENHGGANVELAASYQLITPVSGAVVLETAEQYEQNDLKPVDSKMTSKLPDGGSIPEPRTVLLLVVGGAIALWQLWSWRRRGRLAAI